MLAKAYKLTHQFISVQLVALLFVDNVVLSIAESYFMVNISNNRSTYIPYYLLAKILSLIINNIYIKHQLLHLAHHVQDSFVAKNINKYDRLMFEDRATKPINLFKIKQSNAASALLFIVDWGLFKIVNLLGSVCYLCWVFWQKDLMPELVVSIICNFIIYYHVIRHRQSTFTTNSKSIRLTNQRISSVIGMLSTPFQYGEYAPAVLIDKYQEMSRNELQIDTEFDNVVTMTVLSNQFVSIATSYVASSNSTDFMLIMLSLSRLSNAITGLTTFLTQYNRHNNSYELFEQFWQGCRFEDKANGLVPSPDLQVVKVDAQLDMPISLAPGQKIYIHGKTGEGKTRLVKSIIGKCKGAEMNIGKPVDYINCVSDYNQQIQEQMSTSKVSVRQFFYYELDGKVYYEADNDVISEYLLRTFDVDELNRVMCQLGDYDCDIDEKLSGGQKSRLILTTRGYLADKSNKSIIVLDEPCANVDHDTYTVIMNKFFANYRHLTIIMIAHLCPCIKSKLDVRWDQQYTVAKGVVKLDASFT